MRALGIRFLNREGRELMGNGSDLEHLAEIDDSGLDSRLADTRFTVMCDVTNPLMWRTGGYLYLWPAEGREPPDGTGTS